MQRISMRNKPMHFRFFSIDVFIPTSGFIGLLLISYFALPTSMALLNVDSVTAGVFALAMGHAMAIYITIFIHELGHVIAAKKCKYEVQGIFLHLFGGHTSFFGKYRNPRDQFWTAISGPIFTLFVSVFAFAIFRSTDGLLASLSSWLLWSSIAITVVNLLPGVPLDGGGIVASLVWKITGSQTKGQLVGGYGGYFVAALWVASPFLYQYLFGWVVTQIDILFSTMIGVWLFSAARMTVKMSKFQSTPILDIEQFHALTIKDVARRAIAVDEQLSLDAALNQMRDVGAGSILVQSGDKIIGIVHEKYLEANEDIDNTSPVKEFASRARIEEAVIYTETIAHNPNIDTSFLHGQWITVDDTGAIFGVLHRSDIATRLKSS
jgi:Zn-dependent protease/predicted transcriptional regulator